MSYASTADPAIVALVAILQADPGLSAALVNDGGGLTDSSATDVIAVGYVPQESDDTAVEGGADTAGLDSDQESYDIHCGIGVVSGDEDAGPSARATAFGYLEVIGRAIKQNKTLRGTVARARLSTWSLRQDPTTGGYFARCRFDVHVDAYTRR